MPNVSEMSWLSEPTAWTALAALLTLEIVLGVDNVIFISILASKLPAEQQARARRVGLLAAGGMRLVLLLAVGWIITLKRELFAIGDLGFSGKELILLAGGLFLIFKATKEIHHKLEGDGHDALTEVKGKVTLKSVMVQVALLDLVFSLDSVITAVGMSNHISVMVLANLIALAVMVLTAKSIGDFVQRHPTVKMLALSFLIMIGLVLVADATGLHVPKGYIYFAMGFSIGVECLNMRARKVAKPR